MSAKMPKELGSVWKINPADGDWKKIAAEYEWEMFKPTEPSQKLTTQRIKYVKKAKEAAYGFALILGKNIDVVGCYDGKYEYDLYINYNADDDAEFAQHGGRWVFTTITVSGAKARATRILKKESKA